MSMRPARAVGVVAVGFTLMAALVGCGEWNPWSASPTATAPTATAMPTDAAPTESTAAEPTVTPPPVPSKTPLASATGTALGPLSGTWIGEWTNETPIAGQGTFTLRWGQQGSQLFGTVTIAGSNCLSSGNITGTVIGTHLQFGALEHSGDTSVSIDYSGTVTGPNKLIGTYESTCGPSRGTWTATRT
jgi:hypothetical protein